eukprot:Rhum_TRINITY_DN22003_c0_g1::Rhum_TRINITY_DN22003_c0_g1_i1::g.175093::m.175093
MATPAEQARVSRQKYCDDKHADAAEGAIKLRIQEDWIEYYNAEKKSVFYYCTGTNYRTMNRERTPFTTPARPENGPMVDYDEHAEKPAFVPQKKFVSALLSEAPAAAAEGDAGAGGGSTGAAAIESRVSVSDGAATILKFRDEDREAVAAVSGANKNRALQAQFEEEQRLKRAAEAAEEEKAARKRRLEEEKEEKKEEAKRR